MTAIAWAIVFIGLIFYEAVYPDKATTPNFNTLVVIAAGALAVSTVREWMR